MQKVVATMVHEARFLEELSRSRAIGHRDHSQYWQKVNYGLGIPAVVTATVAGTSAFSEFDQHNVVAGVLALVSAVLTALTTFLDPSKNAGLHQQAATRYGWPLHVIDHTAHAPHIERPEAFVATLAAATTSG